MAVGSDISGRPLRDPGEGGGTAVRGFGASSRRPVPAPGDLLGRDRELTELGDLMRAEPWVTVVGPVAVGKSRLVAEAVRLSDGATPVHADLAAASAAGLDALWDLADAARAAGGPLLIWLDNCDTVLTAVASVAGELLAAGDVNVIATSRRPLGLPTEAVFRVDPLPCPTEPSEVEAPGRNPAVELLLSVAPSINLQPADHDAIVQVCHQASGLPGLLLTAGRMAGTLGWGELARRLVSGRAPTAPSSSGGHTWGAAVDAALTELSALEAEVFERLATFGPTFTLPAAEEVCADAELGPEGVADAVVGLTEKSVLLVRHGSLGPRYEWLGPLRSEAVKRLGTRTDAAALRRRHCEWTAAAAEMADGGWAEEDNAEAAMDWAVGHRELDLALRLAAALTPRWCRSKNPGRYRQRIESVAALASTDVEKASALQRCAELAAAEGDTVAADRFWQEAHQCWTRLGDQAGMGRALTARGAIARRQARYEDAGRLLREGLDLLSRHGGAPGLARALAELGRLAGIRGEPDTGRMMFREALERHRAGGDTAGEATVLACLGDAALLDGQAEEGRRLHEEALRLRRALGDHRAEADSLTRLAAAAWLSDDLKDAGRLCGEAAAMQRHVGDRTGLAKTLTTLAHVAYLQGDAEESERLYRESLGVRTQVGDERGAAAAMVGVANALFLRAEPDLPAALAAASAAAEIQRRIGDRRALAWTAYCLSEMSRDLGDLPSAAAYAEESVALYEQLGAPARARCLPVYALASCRLAAGDVDEARHLTLDALRLAASANALQRLRAVELAGRVAEAAGADQLAVRLMGAAGALRAATPGALTPRSGEAPRIEACLSRLKDRVGAAFLAAWDEGAALSQAEAYRAARLGLESVDGESASTPPTIPAAPEWGLRLLGDFEVRRAGQVVHPPGAVGEKVVKVVVLHGPLPVDAVIEAVWPDAPADAGRRRLANTMARLRKAVGDLVERNGDVLRPAASVSVDAWAFREAAGPALDAISRGLDDAELSASRALALYGGELLPGDRYEDWSATPRVALAQLRLRLLDGLADMCVARGRPREAIDHLMVAIDAEPFDVSRHVLAARILLDQGWRSRARVVLRRAQGVLPAGGATGELAALMGRAGLV